MNLNLDARQTYTIDAYSDSKIQINNISYDKSFIVSRDKIIADLAITNILQLDERYLNLLLESKPEIIIVGHKDKSSMLNLNLLSRLSKERVGIECMEFGSAIRTYNVLLSELRHVVGCFIFPLMP